MTITVIGHGYVGLVSSCVFAELGNTVWVIGRNPEKLKKLSGGDPLIYEPGLEEILKSNLKKGNLHFTSKYEEAISSSDIVFIAVGTPSTPSGQADTKTVFEVVGKLTPYLKQGFTVVSCKSTVPLGTNKKVESEINKKLPKGADFAVASCPEFLREGFSLTDTLNPDRIVIGTESKQAADLLLKLHAPLPGHRIVVNLDSAELIKYAANCLLATKISFANLISFYCERSGADVEQVMNAVGLDKRINRAFLDAGAGYGGACFPKDVKALISIGHGLGIDTGLLNSVEEINASAKENVVNKIIKNAKGKRIALWGLAFKPNTDDVRSATSLVVISELLAAGYSITAYDPKAATNVKGIYPTQISYAKDKYSALDGADLLCVVTEWDEFVNADLKKVKSLLKSPIIVDGRNIWDPSQMKEMGFTYIGVGKHT